MNSLRGEGHTTYAGPMTTQKHDDDTLGPCGCTDYHMADCPTRTGYHDYWAQNERNGYRDDYYDDQR